jgi:hypothetical protein
MMKIIGGAFALPFLMIVMLTSCSSPTSPAAINSTDVMETSMAMVGKEVVETLTAAPTSPPAFLPSTPSPIPPTQTPYFPTPFDRHDPAAVLRAYFDAWNRNDWVARESLRPVSKVRVVPEQVDWIRILEVESISSSPTEYVYRVVFEIQVTGQGISMHSGRYGWKYYLTWDPNRDTWYISNYGGG